MQTRLVCPAELYDTPPAQPTAASDAKVATNASGSNYLAALVSWGQDLARRLTDASAACHAQTNPEGGK